MYLAKKEVELAKRVSEFAFSSALKGDSEKVVTIKRNKNNRFYLKLEDISSLANKERFVPFKYIGIKNHYANDNFLTYSKGFIKEEELLDFYK